MSRENNSGPGFLMGLLAGGAIGAIFALLYAPKSGKEFRNNIKTKADDYMDEADKYISEARDKAKVMINDGKKRSEKLINDARSRSEELLKDAEKILNSARSKASDTIAEGKSTVGKESDNLKSAFKAGVDAYKETKKS